MNIRKILLVAGLLVLPLFLTGVIPTPQGSVAVGTNAAGAYQFALYDANGALVTTPGSAAATQNVTGTGAAGTAATGVVTVQGIASGVAQPISGSVSAAVTGTVSGTGTAGTAASGVMTVQGIASAIPVLVGGQQAVLTAEFTRTADSHTYAQYQVVGPAVTAVLTFSNAARVVGGSGYLVKLRLNKSTTTTANAIFRLYIYSTAPTAIADESAFTLLYANRSNRVTYVDIFSMNTEGTGSDSANAFVILPPTSFTCAAADRNLYGVLVAEGAYVAGNAETFSAELTADQN
jgi:hypothetical protein